MKKTTANSKSARSVKSKSRFKGSSSTQVSLLKRLTANIYYRHPNYFFLNGSSSYENVTPPIIKNLLEQRFNDAGIYSDRRMIQNAFVYICSHQSIDYALPFLPGFPAGLHIINSARILVPQALTLIQPRKGKTDLVDGILLNMLGADQFIRLKGWLLLAYICLQNHERMPGQVLILAGPRNCGKNLVQEHIVTPVLGNRIAEPYRYAVGKTQFNQDLFKAAHLMIADQKKPTERAHMREFIRRMASNDFDSLHPKNKEAIGLPTLWRMTISCNEEPADLKIIPPLDGLEDKLMLFKCALASMPMPTGDITARQKFAAAIKGELPAFIDSLLSFKIPSDLYHERFGIKGYMHPELVRMVRKLDCEEDLLRLIRDAKKLSPQIDLALITAAELHKSLFEIESLREHLLSITRSPSWVGQLLNKLADRNDGTVTLNTVVKGYQHYTINV
jgi:hypothetical protein